MPELPEVECIRRGLEDILVGRKMRVDHIGRSDIVGSIAHPRGQRRGGVTPVPAAHLLDSCVIDCVLRKGKQLAIVSRTGRLLIVRLGMSGQVLSGEALSSKKDHVHVRWSLSDGTSLAFRDARRFGSVIPCCNQHELDAHWQQLGPDALSVGSDDLRGRLQSKRVPVKACLLDQSILAGVGNIYADEALFRARIHPQVLGFRLKREQIDRLTLSLRAVLFSAIEHGGSTLRDFCSPKGTAGSYRVAHQVYGRKGLPCLVCGTTLCGERLGGRASVWCPKCQSRRIKSPRDE